MIESIRLLLQVNIHTRLIESVSRILEVQNELLGSGFYNKYFGI